MKIIGLILLILFYRFRKSVKTGPIASPPKKKKSFKEGSFNKGFDSGDINLEMHVPTGIKIFFVSIDS